MFEDPRKNMNNRNLKINKNNEFNRVYSGHPQNISQRYNNSVRGV